MASFQNNYLHVHVHCRTHAHTCTMYFFLLCQYHVKLDLHKGWFPYSRQVLHNCCVVSNMASSKELRRCPSSYLYILLLVVRIGQAHLLPIQAVLLPLFLPPSFYQQTCAIVMFSQDCNCHATLAAIAEIETRSISCDVIGNIVQQVRLIFPNGSTMPCNSCATLGDYMETSLKVVNRIVCFMYKVHVLYCTCKYK